MRRIRYQVAMSLDGYIAGPSGEADWIITDPEIDFGSLYAQFDTFLVGRRTFEPARSMFKISGIEVFVFSRTLRQQDYPEVTIVAEVEKNLIESLRAKSGKDIWLFGGGELFRSLLDAGLVDTIEVAVIPVLLGGGIPLLPPCGNKANLKLTGHKIYKTGIVLLEYTIGRTTSEAGAH
jgi:dihydrofolate reductase